MDKTKRIENYIKIKKIYDNNDSEKMLKKIGKEVIKNNRK